MSKLKQYAAGGSFVYAIVVSVALMSLGLNHPVAAVITIAYFSTMTIFMFVWLRKEEETNTRQCSDPDCFMCERLKEVSK